MNRNAGFVCLLLLAAACSDGGGGGSGDPDSGLESVEQSAPTTEAPSTTAALIPLHSDTTLIDGLPAVPDLAFAEANEDAGDLAFLTDDATLTGGMVNRFAVARATVAGNNVGHVLVLGVDPAFEQSAVELSFLQDLSTAIPNELGGNAEADDITIERAIVGGTSRIAWAAFYHSGVGYVVWAPTTGERDTLAEALVVALHGVQPFTTLEQMEGTDLMWKFTPLAPPCTWSAMAADFFAPEDQLAAANTWRDGDFPLAQHWAVRQVMCDDASGQLVIVQMHPEFAEHEWSGWYVESYDSEHQLGSVEINGITVYLYDGVLRWAQGDFFYQLSTHYMRRGQALTTWPAFDAASLQAIATQLIQAAAATESAGTDAPPATLPSGTQTVAEVAATIGCTDVHLIETALLAAQTGTCTYHGSQLTISTYSGATYPLGPTCLPGEVVSWMQTSTVVVSGKDAEAVIEAGKAIGVDPDQGLTVLAC